MSVVDLSGHRKVRVPLSFFLMARQASASWASECWAELARVGVSPRIRLYVRARAVVVHDRVLREIDGQPSRIRT